MCFVWNYIEYLKHCYKVIALISYLLLLFIYVMYFLSTCLSQGDLSQLGRVVMQGGFSVWISHKRAAVRMKELARFKPMQRHLFLYDLALLFCKRRDDDTYDRTPFYSFKSCLRVTIYNTLTLLGTPSYSQCNPIQQPYNKSSLYEAYHIVLFLLNCIAYYWCTWCNPWLQFIMKITVMMSDTEM